MDGGNDMYLIVWYMNSVMFFTGGDLMTMKECLSYRKLMEYNMNQSYVEHDPSILKYKKENWHFTCEKTLPVGIGE
jgi:hypothetical protein